MVQKTAKTYEEFSENISGNLLISDQIIDNSDTQESGLNKVNINQIDMKKFKTPTSINKTPLKSIRKGKLQKLFFSKIFKILFVKLSQS